MTSSELEPFAKALKKFTSDQFIESFDFGNGDRVAYAAKSMTAVMFDHETSNILTRDVDEFLDSYYSELFHKADRFGWLQE